MSHRRFAFGVLLWASLISGTGFAEHPDGLSDLRRAAEAAMKAGQWDAARELYEQLFTRDRTRADVRQQFLRAHRMANLVHRHQDTSYREQLAELDLRAACRVYREVVSKLRANYLDTDKTDFTHLFRYGLDELRLALESDVFRNERLPSAVRLPEIQSFRNQLGETWGTRIVQTQRELETEITRVAQAARSALDLDPVVTVLEFACGACHGLDEHTLYLTPSHVSEAFTAVEGDLAGVGIDVERLAENVVIAQVAPGSPGSNASLSNGDSITHIDGKPVSGLTADEVAERLRGTADTLVELQVLPKGQEKSRTLALTRQLKRVPSIGPVHVFPEQPGIGYCRIVSFQRHTAGELDDALIQLQMQGMKALILDLRGNWGGYLPSAIEVSGRFLPAGRVIVTTESQVPEHVRVYKASYPGAMSLPLVVLVDQETASAAEVVAGALHAHHRATLVGQPTFGKWSMQRVLELKSARSGIRVTLARFLSPGSEPYTIKGVMPHVLEERSPISMADNQLLVAIQVAVGMVEMRP